MDLVVTGSLRIPRAEIRLRFSRSGGPGGQHVNKVESRVEAVFDIRTSPSLSEQQRSRLLKRLGPYLDQEGMLHVVAQESRSQWENRERALDKLAAVIREGLKTQKRRVPTVPTRSSREQRIEAKRRRGQKKIDRRPLE